jgi:hypothetical protein
MFLLLEKQLWTKLQFTFISNTGKRTADDIQLPISVVGLPI